MFRSVAIAMALLATAASGVDLGAKKTIIKSFSSSYSSSTINGRTVTRSSQDSSEKKLDDHGKTIFNVESHHHQGMDTDHENDDFKGSKVVNLIHGRGWGKEITVPRDTLLILMVPCDPSGFHRWSVNHRLEHGMYGVKIKEKGR